MSASAAAGSCRSCVLRDGPRLSAGTLGAEGAPASRNLTGTAVAGFGFGKGPGAGATRPTARPAGACTCCITPIAFALPMSSDAADARCIEYSYEGGCIDRRPEEAAEEEATEEEELANKGVEWADEEDCAGGGIELLVFTGFAPAPMLVGKLASES